MKKILVFIGSRANYSSIKSVLTEVKKSKRLKLFIVLGFLKRFCMRAHPNFSCFLVEKIPEGSMLSHDVNNLVQLNKNIMVNYHCIDTSLMKTNF